MKIMAPARAWAYRSSFPNLIKLTPHEETAIIVSMVRIVAKPNVTVTKTTPPTLCFAAGYMIRGIKGSHGPKIKIVKRIQGVMLAFFLCSWT